MRTAGAPSGASVAVRGSMLQTDQRFPSVTSAREGIEQNEDGSFEVYFGPAARQGKEGNWIQTIPGKGWNMLFRLYGPRDVRPASRSSR